MKKLSGASLSIRRRYESREREREESQSCQNSLFSRKGIPIGNLTSQLFANIYLNELDYFVKHKLKEKYYIRYCDDFVIVGNSRNKLESLIPKIQSFLDSALGLKLHENKISIRKPRQGIDFLGYVILPGCRVLRTKTKKRIIKKVNAENLSSYVGILKHCKGEQLEKKISIVADLQKK